MGLTGVSPLMEPRGKQGSRALLVAFTFYQAIGPVSDFFPVWFLAQLQFVILPG